METVSANELVEIGALPACKMKRWRLLKSGAFPAPRKDGRHGGGRGHNYWQVDELPEPFKSKILADIAAERTRRVIERAEDDARRETQCLEEFESSFIYRTTVPDGAFKRRELFVKCKVGAFTELRNGWRHRRYVKEYHPVVAFGILRDNRLFRHVSDDSILEVMDLFPIREDCGEYSRWERVVDMQPEVSYEQFREWGWGKCETIATVFDEGRSRDPAYLMERLAYRHGLFCQRCGDAKSVDGGEIRFYCEEHNWQPSHDNWRQGVCADCAIEIRAEGWKALKRDRDAAAFARRMNENREQLAAAAKQRAEQARKRRLVERAAYEFLAETGLLAQLEETL